LIRRLLSSLSCLFVLLCCSAAIAYAQSSAVSGMVTDPSGAAIASATINLANVETGVTRTTSTDQQGRYQFAQVTPGTYKITAEAAGFGATVADNLKLLVDTPLVVDLPLKLSGNTTQVEVEAGGGAEINTTDASLGNVVDTKPIVQLPLEGRNVTGLLALQPGVTFLKEPDPGAQNDYRSGSVNGGKADQANVLLDGVDVNDQQNRTSFTSVVRVTPDSIQEFRTITANPGAELGHSSGAQVTLVSKSGTNAFHGSLYEFNRNTALEANKYLNKVGPTITPRTTLIRNVFGGSVGGPIKTDRIFFFGAYEGRRDASAKTQTRTIPNCDFRKGIVHYTSTTGTGVLSPEQVRALDPGGIGANAAVLRDMQLYPGCDSLGGGSITDGPDRLNTTSYVFNAKEPLTYNTFMARFDWNVDSAGKHQVFIRGNLQQDNYANGAPQFDHYSDGTLGAPSSVYVNFSKGFAAGYNWMVTQSMVNVLRVGFTRQSAGFTGTQTAAPSYFDGITPLYPIFNASNTQAGGTASAQQLPVWDIRDDVSWTRGRHSIGFGGEIFLLKNNIESNANSFSSAFMDGLYLYQDGATLQPQDFAGGTEYALQIDNLLGLEAKLYRRTNFDLQGNVLPDGQSIRRTFSEKHFDLYVQDSWKARTNLTLTAGVRFTTSPPIFETQGYNVVTNIPTSKWLAQRGSLAAQGASQNAVPMLSYELGSAAGKSLYDRQNDFAPRVSFAYTPKFDKGFLHALSGGENNMSIRGGFGLFYDAFGEGLAKQFSNAAGFSTISNNKGGQQIAGVPRYTGFYDVPFDSALMPASPAGGFPQTLPAGTLTQANSVDNSIRSPYSFEENLSIAREFHGGFLLQASWVGRQSRRSLTGEDIAAPTDLVDPSSGMDYFAAAKLMGIAADTGEKGADTIAPIPFFENLWPSAATAGKTATQNIYDTEFKQDKNDYTTPLLDIDAFCSVGCSKLGQYAMFNSQYIANYAYRSIGAGDYNALQLLIRKAYSQGYQFDFNYTLSKCLDLGSTPESTGASTSIGSILNTWNPSQMKAVCDYDLRHQVTAMVVAELPVGKGKAFLNHSGRLMNELVGGWQLTSIFRQTSGFAGSVSNGVGYPTVWDFTGYATKTGKLPGRASNKTQLFSNSAVAFSAFSPTFAGESGSRNVVRGDGLITWDVGAGKRFHLFALRDHPHTLQFRMEGFNITNTARIDVQNYSLSGGNKSSFGVHTSNDQIVDPRVFQAALRYEF